jgi:hypothetical protein
VMGAHEQVEDGAPQHVPKQQRLDHLGCRSRSQLWHRHNDTDTSDVHTTPLEVRGDACGPRAGHEPPCSRAGARACRTGLGCRWRARPGANKNIKNVNNKIKTKTKNITTLQKVKIWPNFHVDSNLKI